MNSPKAGSRVRHVVVPEDRSGQRLDNFLVGHLSGVPRSLVYRLVRTGQVRVNGGRAKPMKKLRGGDEVRIPPVAIRPEDQTSVPDELVEHIKSRIIEQNEDFIVIDKPSGLAMHGGSGISLGLMNVLARINEDWRPVHRLDRPTSGLLILGGRHRSLVALQRELAGRRVDKRYLALMTGVLPEALVTVDRPLKKIRDGSGQHRVVVDETGQSALTRFRVLERLPGHTYVEAEIETGRTHQIRAHAAALGYPLAGDERYNEQAAPDGLRRLFLHAHYLRLSWPEDRVFSSPLPDELGAVLDALRAPARTG
ncbi:MAG: RluA family pseudouridine synthase [Wenzhouxiangella sp.]|nr:MAG: RluA family pseudouridine synthase [Wenzhouxiangella sp.]